jgi:membrane protein implicated in regulation of membrane protease activity
MMLIEFLASYGGWSWLVAGLVMLALELAVPGGFLLWMGIAGIITGIVTLRYPMDWPIQWLMFGGFSLAAIVLWTMFYKKRPEAPDRLNRRIEQLIGKEAVLETGIGPDYGRIALGDTVWLVSGEELPGGTRVRIVGADGAVLKVVAAGN